MRDDAVGAGCSGPFDQRGAWPRRRADNIAAGADHALPGHAPTALTGVPAQAGQNPTAAASTSASGSVVSSTPGVARFRHMKVKSAAGAALGCRRGEG